MKEHPIIFNGDMVKAILAGRKTQTRRPIIPQPTELEIPGLFVWKHFSGDTLAGIIKQCPHGQPGDRLWVRETWGASPFLNKQKPSDLDPSKVKIFYKSDWPQVNESHYMWRPSIHMPRWASRITLELTGLRVERVQDITPDDAKAEGFTGKPLPGQLSSRNDGYAILREFQYEWDKIYPTCSRSWYANPWCWVLEFRQVKG